MLDIDGASMATSKIEPGKLSPDESEPGPATRTLSIENNAAAGVTYDLSHDGALRTGPAAQPAGCPPRQSVCTPLVHAVAFAPASIGNVAVDFDVLGQSTAVLGDRVRASRKPDPGVRVGLITGIAADLPLDAASTTASVAVTAMADALGIDHGFVLAIEKGIPFASGLGGSAASAVAAVVAANALLETPVEPLRLLGFAAAGESVASGSPHLDNKAAALAAGALGCSIAGAGPTMFAWCEAQDAEAVRLGMAGGFGREGLAADSWIAPRDTSGAKVIERS